MTKFTQLSVAVALATTFASVSALAQTGLPPTVGGQPQVQTSPGTAPAGTAPAQDEHARSAHHALHLPQPGDDMKAGSQQAGNAPLQGPAAAPALPPSQTSSLGQGSGPLFGAGPLSAREMLGLSGPLQVAGPPPSASVALPAKPDTK